MIISRRWQIAFYSCALSVIATNALAQAAPGPSSTNPDGVAGQHEHMQMNMDAGWAFMQDGIVWATFNHQGGSRGGDEFVVPNWWMGMATRDTARGRWTFTAMFSLDPITVGKNGYRKIFQSGEALNGRPLVDRQHPHDLFMQLAAIWRIPLTDTTGFTIAGGPAGEPALGPVAFMHRASASENPSAPLGHHTFDSTHISYGAITAAVDHGKWIVEGSLFNGREPDDNRWDFDFGPLDSVSTRVWFRPNDEWEFQASTGFLKQPEELEPGNVVRTTFSGSWFKRQDMNFTAITAGYGWNHKDEGNHGNFFTEATWHAGMNSVFGRFEVHQPEVALLVTGLAESVPALSSRRDTVLAFTLGGVRDFLHARGFELGVGGDFSVYGVPDVLESPAAVCARTTCVVPVGYGSRPASFHVFLRLRPPASKGRMWNMRMSQPMPGHQMEGMHHQ